ncbi:MAG: FAD-dependent oxidoreductase [Coprothermobacterota bacterium]|nr:FAD-dependent oxidoreductase [Coprothermobacterota bacterium]
MSEIYDLIIVGAGPAGIFTALELTRQNFPLRILLLEKGQELNERSSLMCGWGGAGAFSDGKLTLTAEIGGYLKDIVGPEEAARLIEYVDHIYLDFGAPTEIFGADEDAISALRRRAAMASLRFVPAKIRHLGTDNCTAILQRFRDHLAPKVEIRTGCHVSRILVEEGIVRGVQTSDGKEFQCRILVMAPGREGAAWLVEECQRLQLTMTRNPVDVGVRVEVPAAVLEPLTTVSFEAKLEYFSRSFDDRVRTFCMCPYGVVAIEKADGVTTVNGHSYANRKTENSNFAILVSTRFTAPFKEPITYGRYIAQLANLLGGGVIVQRLGDLQTGRRSTHDRLAHGIVTPSLTEATPGDLSFVLPYRHLTNILEMLQALDQLTPGIASRHTLLYGIEVKFYSARPQVTPSLETEVTNLFAIGDGAGLTRGLMQASATGVLVARRIVARLAQ